MLIGLQSCKFSDTKIKQINFGERKENNLKLRQLNRDCFQQNRVSQNHMPQTSLLRFFSPDMLDELKKSCYSDFNSTLYNNENIN